jgi:hypothetical protein
LPENRPVWRESLPVCKTCPYEGQDIDVGSKYKKIPHPSQKGAGGPKNATILPV